jgi:uncharacterized protein (DUF1810 family)
MPKQIFHAKQHFSVFHARSQIQDAAAEAYQLAVPGLNTAFRAKPYLNHPVLETRLRECTGLINAVEGRSIEQILGK